jgi:N-acyl-D-aspartate/D-glutamate deacylase
MRYNPRVSIMKKILVPIVVLLIAATACAENLILMNGTIIDGTLKARFAGNVRIRDGKITDIGVVRPAPGETVLDIKGMIVAPGFVDLQNHSAAALDKDHGAATQIAQGITTALLGADGTGPYSVEQFMARYDDRTPALNIVTLVGHATVRRQIMGEDYKRAATPDEISRMALLIEDGMRQGAFGVSSDLTSDPSSYSTNDELNALATSAAKYGGFFAVRLRDENARLTESVAELVELGRSTKVRVQITHPRTHAMAVLAAIDKARMQGVDISADTSPYDDGASPETEKELRAYLQHPWVMIASDGGMDTKHPRSAGTFPRALGYYAREQKVITLERAIRKMTGLPAARIGFKERGTLFKGAAADIVVFDPLKVRDQSTADNPFAPSVGIRYVFVNGTMVVKDGEVTAERPGVALR